jgi:hypothetical protein
MTKPKKKLEPSEETRAMATYIAMVVRNALEDFHCTYLSDEEMQELNPIIRNAICTALYSFQNRHRSEAAKAFVEMTLKMVPEYWEKPELIADYLNLEAYVATKKT